MILSTRRSKHALLALSFFVTMALVVFSTLLYFAERGTWDESLETFVDSEGVKTQFESIPAAAWFVLVSAYLPPFPNRPVNSVLTKLGDHNRWIWRDYPAYFPRTTDHRSSPIIRTITRCATQFRTRTRIRRSMGGNECRVCLSSHYPEYNLLNPFLPL